MFIIAQFILLVAVVVAQLAGQSLPTPEDPGSNQAISNFGNCG